MLCEIPLGTTPKIEVSTKLKYNPLRQDAKAGKPRHLKYKWPNGVICNYGSMPQTYEDPKIVDKDGHKGDADPLDVIELSGKPMQRGQIAQVKILGSLALIDDNEVDWKVFCIDTQNPLAKKLNDIADVERELPGRISELREWYRVYKTAEGKGVNTYAYNGKALDKAQTIKVIEEAHKHWKKLINDPKNKNVDGIGKSNIKLSDVKKSLEDIPRI